MVRPRSVTTSPDPQLSAYSPHFPTGFFRVLTGFFPGFNRVFSGFLKNLEKTWFNFHRPPPWPTPFGGPRTISPLLLSQWTAVIHSQAITGLCVDWHTPQFMKRASRSPLSPSPSLSLSLFFLSFSLILSRFLSLSPFLTHSHTHNFSLSYRQRCSLTLLHYLILSHSLFPILCVVCQSLTHLSQSQKKKGEKKHDRPRIRRQDWLSKGQRDRLMTHNWKNNTDTTRVRTTKLQNKQKAKEKRKREAEQE